VSLVALVLGGPFKSPKAIDILESSQTKYLPLLRGISESLRPEETLLVCSRTRQDIYAGAISVFASNGRPYEYVDGPDDLAKRKTDATVSPPYRGLCSEQDFNGLRPSLRDPIVVQKELGYVHWTDVGTRSP
jgi:hypothetical protein